MPYAILEKQFDLLTEEHKKSVYSYVTFLLSEQSATEENKDRNVSEKLSLLNSLVGIVPSNVDLNVEKTERIFKA